MQFYQVGVCGTRQWPYKRINLSDGWKAIWHCGFQQIWSFQEFSWLFDCESIRKGWIVWAIVKQNSGVELEWESSSMIICNVLDWSSSRCAHACGSI